MAALEGGGDAVKPKSTVRGRSMNRSASSRMDAQMHGASFGDLEYGVCPLLLWSPPVSGFGDVRALFGGVG